jgi:uncharacterized protein YdcH (DUF465 family)
MLNEDKEWLDHVRKGNREFVELEQHHRRLERELSALLKRRIMPADDEVRKKTLQKEKLAAKDRMNEILRQSKLAETTH